MSDGEKLEVVDEDGNVLHHELRTTVHQKGLLHREIHIFLYTSDGSIILQKRAKDKDTYPGLLDVSVGGHVEIGDTFEETAVKELYEESGISASIQDVKYIDTIRSKSHDDVTKTTNNVIRAIYIYKYDDKIENLVIEKGKSDGFEKWNIESFFNPTKEDRLRIISTLLEEPYLSLFRKMQYLNKLSLK